MRQTSLVAVVAASSLVMAVPGRGDGLVPRVTQASEFFQTPTLTGIRDILAQYVPAIVSTIVQRMALPVKTSLYEGGTSSTLHCYLADHENNAKQRGRYDYGAIEFPFTFNGIPADKSSATNPYPPGRYHQDTFTPSDNLTAFYVQEFIPLLNQSIDGYWAHLSNASQNLFPDKTDDDAALNLDVQLLQLLASRANNGKLVAESKFVGNVTTFTSLIQAKNTSGILTLLTNRTQESVVLQEAANAATVFTNAWISAGAIVPPTFSDSVQNATFKVFRNLIDITTQVELEYLLARFN